MDTRGVVNSLFGVPRALIGVIHVGALPGTPSNRKTVAAIADEAVREARVYETAGFHGLAIENTHDRPYLKSSVGPEIGAANGGGRLRGAKGSFTPVGNSGARRGQFVGRRDRTCVWRKLCSSGGVCLRPCSGRGSDSVDRWVAIAIPSGHRCRECSSLRRYQEKALGACHHCRRGHCRDRESR